MKYFAVFVCCVMFLAASIFMCGCANGDTIGEYTLAGSGCHKGHSHTTVTPYFYYGYPMVYPYVAPPMYPTYPVYPSSGIQLRFDF